MSDFDKKYNIVDENTPPQNLMSGRYKKSFAYYTLRERLPVILTQVLDNLSRDKDLIAKKYGEKVREELKEIVGNISKLKYELQTDKPLTTFTGDEPDKELWNQFIDALDPENNSFFKTCWLYAECYLYRRLSSFFEETYLLKKFDYFQKQKENALVQWTDTLEVVVRHIRSYNDKKDLGGFFKRLLKLNLWGNRCDLSISEGREILQSGDPFSAIDPLDEYILVNQSSDIWNCLTSESSKVVAFINDNSGYEIFTDFLIAEFLIDHGLASKIRFNVKPIPWFISDVTPPDFHWTLSYLSNHQSQTLKEVGIKWKEYLKLGTFELEEPNYFWTSPYEFYRMQEVSPSLYKKLSEAHLIIFKGDLNYRKLIGDFAWDYTEDFQTCLRSFRPTNLCSLRTVKADLICGLQSGVAENLSATNPSWMTTGEYGVIQFASKN